MKSNAFINGYLEGYMTKQAVMQQPKAIVGDPAAAITKEDVAKAQAFKAQSDAKKPEQQASAGTGAANKINQAAAERKAALAM